MRNIMMGILSQKYELDWVIPIAGQTSGTPTAGTMTFSASEDLVLSATGDVTISVVNGIDDVYRLHTVTINCPNNGSGTIVVKDRDKIVSYGNHGGASNPSVNFYAGVDSTAPILSWNLNDISVNCEKIRQVTQLLTILPTTGNQALPTGLTFLYLQGNNIAWTYTGALPTNLTYLRLLGTNIDWTYTGALPTGLTYLYLNGANMNWTYTGALPNGLTILSLIGDNINWTYTGALPTNLIYLVLNGANINWTGLDLGNDISPENYVVFQLLDYVITPLTIAQLLTLLENIDTKTGNLPATTYVRDYDATSPNPTEVEIRDATANVSGTDAEQARYWINQILGHGGITTFQLNTTNITL